MEIPEYERLVSSETKALQVKVTTAIDAAIKTVGTKQAELMNNIKTDPRNTHVKKIKIKLALEVSEETDEEFSNRHDLNKNSF